MDVDVLADAVARASRREPFVLATVVWRRGPSSGHVGSKAVIDADGSVQGWLGGACAAPTVVREARSAMADGQPRLVFLGQSDELDQRADTVTVPMACDSEGAMEVYLEPVLPRPQVVAIGRSPAVSSLASLTIALDWEAVVIDDGGNPDDHPHPDLVRTTLDLSGLGVDRSTAIVVGTQGNYDEAAIEAALGTDAGYIGLVSSEKRAASTFDLLRRRGVTDEQLSRVVAPAGLDLGAIENAEIGVAVLADLVARRATGQLSGSSRLSAAAADAVDPVCGMSVDPLTARHRSSREGHDIVFCSAACKAAYDADPAAYQSAVD